MKVRKEEIRYILQFFLDKGENESQMIEIVNGTYGPDAVIANYLKLRVRQIRLGIFHVKDVPQVKNVYKITEMIEIDWHFSSRSIARELKIDCEAALNHLHKAGFKTNL